MKKMLKIAAMLLVIAAVVSAAGCAGKEKTAGEKQETPNQTSAEVASTTPEETPAETTEIAATPVETPELTNNTTENITENVTAQNVTHISNTQRKMAMIKNQTKSSDTVNVSQNDSE